MAHRHDAAGSLGSALESGTEGIRAVKISLVDLGVTAIAQLVVVLITGWCRPAGRHHPQAGLGPGRL